MKSILSESYQDKEQVENKQNFISLLWSTMIVNAYMGMMTDLRCYFYVTVRDNWGVIGDWSQPLILINPDNPSFGNDPLICWLVVVLPAFYTLVVSERLTNKSTLQLSFQMFKSRFRELINSNCGLEHLTPLFHSSVATTNMRRLMPDWWWAYSEAQSSRT